MPTLDFFRALYNWVMADITHVVIMCSLITMVTPTPRPGTWLSRLYSIIDAGALNLWHAKSTGVTITPEAIAAQALAQLQKQQPVTQPTEEQK